MSINNDGSDPDPSAMLDISSTNQGLLVPRMTQSQRDGITGAAFGLLIFQTDGEAGFYVHDGVSSWFKIIIENDTNLLDVEQTLALGNNANGQSLVNLGSLAVGSSSVSPSSLLDVAGKASFDTVLINGAFVLPSVDGSAGYVMKTDGNGILSWDTIAGDNLGNHAATQNLQLDTFWLSSDGSNSGLFVDGTGKVIVSKGIYHNEYTTENYLEFLGNNATSMYAGDFLTFGSGKQINLNVPKTVTMASVTDSGMSIGTTAPTSLLHVSGSFGASLNEGAFVDIHNQNGVNNALSGVRFKVNGATGDQRYNAAIFHRFQTGTDYELSFAVQTNNVANVDTADIKMTVQQDGHVGIGTTDPVGLLHVRGTPTQYSSERSGIRAIIAAGGSASTTTYGVYSEAAGGGGGNQTTYGLYGNATTGGGGGETAIGLYASGSTYAGIFESGNVGIGTTTPAIKLHLDGGSDASLSTGGYLLINEESTTNLVIDDNEIQARNNGAASNLYLQNEGGGLTVHSSLGGTSVVTIESDGDVGIGEASPQASLDVHDKAVVGNISIGSESSFQAASDHADLGYTTTPWLYSHAIEAPNERGTGSTAVIVGDDGNFGSTDEIHLVTTGESQLMVASNGEVGIGTDSPNDVVHAQSTSNVRFRAQSSSDGYAGFVARNTVSGTNYEYFLGVQGSADANPGEFHIYQNAPNSGQRLVMDVNGQVGIDRPNPTHILHINGQGRASSSLWATSSDARAKQNILTIDSASALLMQLRPVTFEWSSEYQQSHNTKPGTNYGFISQEVETVLPFMVTEVQEVMGNDTIHDFKVLDKDPLIALLVRATQEQEQKIDSLSASNEQLMRRLLELEKLLGIAREEGRSEASASTELKGIEP